MSASNLRLSYDDSKGRPRVLSFVQWVYLSTAERRGGFVKGWGGLDNTLTVRLLDERGLLTLDARRSPWRVTGITALGRKVLDQWAATVGGES